MSPVARVKLFFFVLEAAMFGTGTYYLYALWGSRVDWRFIIALAVATTGGLGILRDCRELWSYYKVSHAQRS
jgi:hypothetical protein